MKITNPSHPLYLKACKRESQFWSGDTALEYDHIPQRVQEYENIKRTGSKETNDFSFLKSLGTFPRGLSIGSGGGKYELKLLQERIVEHFVFIDISESALIALKHNAEEL